MFSARSRTMILSDLNTDYVILEDKTLNLWNIMVEGEFAFLEFIH